MEKCDNIFVQDCFKHWSGYDRKGKQNDSTKSTVFSYIAVLSCSVKRFHKNMANTFNFPFELITDLTLHIS